MLRGLLFSFAMALICFGSWLSFPACTGEPEDPVISSISPEPGPGGFHLPRGYKAGDTRGATNIVRDISGNELGGRWPTREEIRSVSARASPAGNTYICGSALEFHTALEMCSAGDEIWLDDDSVWYTWPDTIRAGIWDNGGYSEILFDVKIIGTDTARSKLLFSSSIGCGLASYWTAAVTWDHIRFEGTYIQNCASVDTVYDVMVQCGPSYTGDPQECLLTDCYGIWDWGIAAFSMADSFAYGVACQGDVIEQDHVKYTIEDTENVSPTVSPRGSVYYSGSSFSQACLYTRNPCGSYYPYQPEFMRVGVSQFSTACGLTGSFDSLYVDSWIYDGDEYSLADHRILSETCEIAADTAYVRIGLKYHAKNRNIEEVFVEHTAAVANCVSGTSVSASSGPEASDPVYYDYFYFKFYIGGYTGSFDYRARSELAEDLGSDCSGCTLCSVYGKVKGTVGYSDCHQVSLRNQGEGPPVWWPEEQ